MSIEFLSKVNSRIGKLMDATVTTLNHYEYFDQAEEVKSMFNRKINDDRFIITVYGIYNAGKSTFINALFGKEMAEIGDIPTTSKVTSFPWQDVIVQDSPGIDAPEEHEQISNEELRKSDIVLFMIGSGDGTFEEQKVWEQIKYILDMGKHLVVLINDHNRFMFSVKGVKELQKIQGKFMTRSKKEIGREINPLILNARAAWQIKKGPSRYTLEDTGLPQIEVYITQKVMSTPKVQRFDIPLKTAIEHLTSILASKNQNLSAVEQELFQKEHDLRTYQEEILLRLDELINEEESQLMQQLTYAMFNGEDPISTLENSFQKILTNLDLELELTAPEIKISHEKDVNSDTKRSHGLKYADKAIFKPLDKFLREPETSRKIQVELYRSMKNKMTKPENLRWRDWKDGLWKKSGNYSKGLGFALQIGMAGWEYYKNKKEQEFQLEKKKEEKELIVNEAKSIINNFSSILRIDTTNALKKTVGESKAALRAEYEDVSLHSDLNELNKLIDDLNNLRNEIKSYGGS